MFGTLEIWGSSIFKRQPFLFFLSPTLHLNYLSSVLRIRFPVLDFSLTLCCGQVEFSLLHYGFPNLLVSPGALVLIRAFASWTPRRPRPVSLLLPRDMANSMNEFDLDYSATNRDDHEDVRNGVLQSSLSAHDPALMDLPSSYSFSAMLAHDGDLDLHSFGRPGQQQGDLEGRLSDVMLTYDSIPSTMVSMPMSVDAGNAFAYDVPASYPATAMELATQMNQSQLQSVFSPFAQSMAPVGQYLQQPSASQPREDTYNTATGSTGSYVDSNSSRASDRSQALISRSSQGLPQYGRPFSYGSLQPVAIQPKKAAAVKGEYFVRKLRRLEPLAQGIVF